MKNTKRLITLTLSLMLSVLFIFALSACNLGEDEHTHDYQKTVTQAASCTEKGTATFTCNCGDSYTEEIPVAAHTLVNEPAMNATCTSDGYAAYERCTVCDYSTYVKADKTGHSYEAKTTRFPSTAAKGIKTYTCKNCSDSYTEEIAAVSFSLPSVSETIASVIGSGIYTAEIGEGTTFVTVKELDDYTYSSDAYKHFIAINLAEATLNTKGVVVEGYIKLEFGISEYELSAEVTADSISTPTTFTDVFAIEIYLNGDSVSVSYSENEEVPETAEYDLKEVFYGEIAESMGITYEELVDAAYIVSKGQEFLPVFEKIIENLQNMEWPEANIDLVGILNVIGDEIVKTTVNTDNTVYTIDIAALAALVDEYKGETVAELIDAQYGVGTASAISAYLVALPDMPLKEIIDSAIALSESCGVSVYDICAYINLIVYKAAGIEFDIEAELDKRYNDTLAQIVVEMMVAGNTGVDTAAAITMLKANLANIVSTILNATPDALYHMVNCTSEEVDHTANECTAFSDTLLGVIAMADSAASVEVTVAHETGAILAMTVSVSDPTTNTVLFSTTYTNNGDGTYNGICYVNGYNIAVKVTSTGAEITVTSADVTVFKGSVTNDENGFNLNGEMTVDESTVTVKVVSDSDSFEILLKEDEYTLLSLVANLDETGAVNDAEFLIYSLSYITNADTQETVTMHEKQVEATLTVTNTDTATETLLTISADGSTAAFTVTESTERFLATLVFDEKQLLKVEAISDETGVITSATIDLNVIVTETTKVYDATTDTTTSKTTETLVDCFDLTYQNADGAETITWVAKNDTTTINGTATITKAENVTTITYTLTDTTGTEINGTSVITVTPDTEISVNSDVTVKITQSTGDGVSVTETYEIAIDTVANQNGLVSVTKLGENEIGRTEIMINEAGQITKASTVANVPITDENGDITDQVENMITFSYENDYAGNITLRYFIFGEVEYLYVLSTVENTISLKAYVETNGVTMLDGTVDLTVSAEENKSTLTLAFDIDKYMASMITHTCLVAPTANADGTAVGTEIEGEVILDYEGMETVEFVEVSYHSFLYVILCGSITFTCEK